MNDVVRRLESLTSAPSEPGEFAAWLSGVDAVEFLKANLHDDEFVVCAGADHTFIHTVLVPAERVERPDVEDLLAWNFGIQSGWSVNVSFGDPSRISLAPPLDHETTKALNGAQVLVFYRSFAGRLGDDKNYWEFFQPFLHVFGLHFLSERNAYCRLDERGDIEDMIRIVPVAFRGGTVVTVKRVLLDEWMLLTGSAMVRMFDFTRYSRASLGAWQGGDESRHEEEDLFYRRVLEPGSASFLRGCQIVRSNATISDLHARWGWTALEERQYGSFVAWDWKNKRIAEISTSPDATANYFTLSELPFETSPAFFRPEVLLKYKADRDKYRIEHRSITCRETWHLKGFGFNDAGQVFAYIVYLRALPYEEQLHWKAYNEPPRAGLPRDIVKTDFEGRRDVEPDPLSRLKYRLEGWWVRRVPWWRTSSRSVLEGVHRPVTTSADEWANDILNLHQVLVEGFVGKWLRSTAERLGCKPDPGLGSLKLLEQCLMGLNFEESQAREVTAPLHRLHYYRSKLKGHASGQEAVEIKRSVLTDHGSYGKHFDWLCTECDTAVRDVEEALKGLHES